MKHAILRIGELQSTAFVDCEDKDPGSNDVGQFAEKWQKNGKNVYN